MRRRPPLDALVESNHGPWLRYLMSHLVPGTVVLGVCRVIEGHSRPSLASPHGVRVAARRRSGWVSTLLSDETSSLEYHRDTECILAWMLRPIAQNEERPPPREG